MTTIWNFQKLPSYTFYGGNVVRVLAVPDTVLEIRDWGQSSKPLEKGGGGGGSLQKTQKNFFRPFGPQFGLKIRGNPGPSPGSVTFLLFFFFHCLSFSPLVAESISHFLTTATKFSCCSSNKKTTLLFLISRLLSLYLCLSLFLYSKFVDMTINRQYGYRNNFRFPFSSLFTL